MPLQVVYETHSTTTDNEQGIATGWRPGRLSPAGREQAAELGRRRRDDGLDLVLCSDLGRAVETCEVAFAGTALPVRQDPRLRECDYAETSVLAEDLGAVYEAAFAAPPYQREGAAARRFVTEQLPAHAQRSGFRCAVLRVDERVVGFAYCYTGGPGQWWTDEVARHVPTDLVARWLGGHLELVELAVRPEVQGRGYATALHDALLQGVPHDRALLTTAPGDFPAARLYRRLGWQLLHAGVFETSDLWGLDLNARRRAT